MSQFNAQSTTDDVIRGTSLAGRVALVTGASSGLGVETARALAKVGARVVLLARDETRLAAAAAALRDTNPALELDTVRVDLADLDSVREAAAAILKRYPSIDILINNAGVMACPLERTSQGFEMQFGTNHLGHFLFTLLLAPALLAAADSGRGDSRVVSLSSAGHRFANVNLEDPNYHQREYQKWAAYGESKTANALFAVGLDDRLASRGVRALAVHPGVIMTELSRHMEQADFDMLTQRAGGEKMQLKSVEQGSATSVWAASSPDLAGRGGLYLEDCQIARPAAPGEAGGVESYALDHVAAARLWTLSEELVAETFNC